MHPPRRLSPPPTSATNSVRQWCDSQGIAHTATNDDSGEGWTKKPSDAKAVEFSTKLWNVRETGSAQFQDWVWDNSWRWSDADTLFGKFKTWLARNYAWATLKEKNAIYSGLSSDVVDLEMGATMKQLGKNFDEGREMTGTENIIPIGFSSVPDKLATMITAFPNCQIRLNEKVVKVTTMVDETSVSRHRSTVALSSGLIYSAPRVIVSIPLGVLQYGNIAFEPKLPDVKVTAVAKLGMGLLNKITLLYSENFWRNDANGLGTATWFTVFDPTANPVGAEPPKPQREFWNAARYFDNKPVVTMLYGATTADDYEKSSDSELVKIADDLFRSLWTGTTNAVVDSYVITRWRADEHARGSYSYLPPGATVGMRRSLCKHLDDGVYWAGEHCSIDLPATVNGAFESGASAAKAILDATPKPTRRPTTQAMTHGDTPLIEKYLRSRENYGK